MTSQQSPTKYYSVTETAKFIRQALKIAFPGMKFSVRSDSYSGGASVDIRWTDGPSVAAVEAVGKRFQGATFDGMQDLMEYHRNTEVAPDGSLTSVRYGADFVSGHRNFSRAFIEKAAETYRAKYGTDAFEVKITEYEGGNASGSLVHDMERDYSDFYSHEDEFRAMIYDQVA